MSQTYTYTAPPGWVPVPTRAARRRNPLRVVLLATVALAVMALGVLVAAGLLVRPPQTAYANEDYQVPPASRSAPPLPQPADDAEATKWVRANVIYGQAVPAPVRCNLAPLPDGAKATDAQLETHLNALTECLVRAWQPPVTAAGFQINRPTVTIYGEHGHNKCGDPGPVNAAYCSADQQIYFSDTLLPGIPELNESRWAGDAVMAHEFGHLVQARTGILTSVYLLRNDADTKQADLEVARRKEQQADCFAGEFLRSTSRSLALTQADVAPIENVFGLLGDDPGSDDRDHGIPVSRKFWTQTGLGHGEVGACNTFVAPTTQVR